MEPTVGHVYRIRFASGNHAVYCLMSVSECCWEMADKGDQRIHVNPKTIETIRDVTGDSQYALTVGD